LAAGNICCGRLMIGCEPFLNGLVSAVDKIAQAGLSNIRLHRGDALDVLERLPDASLDRVFLLHPDPWPKARHAKRRFINPGPLDQLARVLKPGGLLRIGTDDPGYCRWTLMHMLRRPEFSWTAHAHRDWSERPPAWPQTRYEAKARAMGHDIWFFAYTRV
jgi:tRNA (guanine-N7-)-methyltransferase